MKKPMLPRAESMALCGDTVAATFDYPPDETPPLPPGACADYGQELPDGHLCRATCPVSRECYGEYMRRSR